MRNIFTIPFLLIFFISCSVQKRIHQPGYHITWKHAKNNVSKKQTIVNAVITKQSEKQETPVKPVTPAMENELALASPGPVFLSLRQNLLPAATGTTGCDVIIMQNGDEISAKVSEITSEVIKYKRCDYPDGPLYTASKQDVFMIKYANGSKEVIRQQNTNQRAGIKETKPIAKKRFEPRAIGAFILSILALFMPVEMLVISMLMLLISVVLGIIAINKINARPDELRGRGFAITAIVIGLLFGALWIMAFIMI